MKAIIKSILLAVVFTTISCSSGDTVENPGAPEEEVVVLPVAMTTNIDGELYSTPPQIGGNAAENSGGTFGGSAYFLLKGYKNFNTGKVSAKVGNKIINIYLAIPKNDLSVGTHSFSSAFNTGDYYADMDISGVTPLESAVTTSGSITITSYNASTKVLKGNFNFTTNDGVDPLTVTHQLFGTFTYVLP